VKKSKFSMSPMKTKQEEEGNEELGEVDVVKEDKASTKPW
jgi:hypothetical protein